MEEKIKIFVEKPIAQSRYDICKKCEYFSKTTSLCKQCHCIMKLKVTLNGVTCPINKW